MYDAWVWKLVGLALLLAMAVLGGGCFELSWSTVSNQTGAPRRVISFTCGVRPTQQHFERLQSQTILPGETLKVTVLDGMVDLNQCLVVASVDYQLVAETPLEKKSAYVLNSAGEGGRVEFSLSGAYDDPEAIEFSLPGWVWWIIAGPLLAGALVALYITVRYFWDYYGRGIKPA